MEYFFIHKEWNDLCILDNNIIYRKNINNERGYYYYENDELIIKWDNWDNKNEFRKINEYFIDKNIINNIDIINVYYKDINKKFILLKKDNKIIEENKSNKIENRINYKINKNIINVIYDDNIIDYLYCKNNEYFELNYYLSKNENISNYDNNLQINDKKIIDDDIDDENDILNIDKKEIFILVDNTFCNKEYLDNYNINENNNYCINLNIDFDKNENLFFNYSKFNKNYLDINNFIKFKKKYVIDKSFLLENFFKIKLHKKFKINRNKNRIVTLSEWGYPPFGGGENWLLNLSYIFNEFNYDTYIICFSDGFSGNKFTENNFIDLDYVKIIQMPFNIYEIVKIIKYISPTKINHQGIKRIEFMKIANLLNIPFITGFCFWNNIIKEVHSNIEILKNNNITKDNSFNLINDYSYTYCASEFVNDIIQKYFNKKIYVIETISLKNDYYTENKESNKYVTLLNCHYNKGGFILKYLLENLNINIPLLIVYTEYDDKIDFSDIKNLLKLRNNKNNINILFEEKQNVKDIYEKTKIMLVPSLCDETFCRVAYEAKMNNIPIISTDNGNLKYLLKNYSLFIYDNNPKTWKSKIEYLYSKIKLKNNNTHKIIDIYENKIKNNVQKLLNEVTISKYIPDSNNILIIAPWADQGLGIQARSYYNTLKKLGYNIFIFSFKPYHASEENNFLQVDRNEWDYENIYYSPNYRENIDPFEILNVIHNNKIKNVILIEATFEPIFKIISLLKLININTFLIVNIECVKITEINHHLLFDKILCNNFNSYYILNNLLPNKCSYLGFHLDNNYFDNYIKETKNNKKLKFVCCGGLNSISRKNIDKIFESFYNILSEKDYDVELTILIQGIEISNKLNKEHIKINKKFKNYSYVENLNNISKNDIFIHCGGQEGLGLGFYEALYLGLPVLTLDWTPNNEIIKDNYNGWLIPINIDKVYENQECLINRAVINNNNLKNKILEIITNLDNTNAIINNTINNKDYFIKRNKNKFENNLSKFLSTTPDLN